MVRMSSLQVSETINRQRTRRESPDGFPYLDFWEAVHATQGTARYRRYRYCSELHIVTNSDAGRVTCYEDVCTK